MLRLEEFMEIKILAKQGMSIKEIARRMGISRNTVRKHLRSSQEPSYLLRSKKTSKLDDYKNYLINRLETAKPFDIPSTVLFREICKEGYKGRLTILRDFIRGYKQKEAEEIIRFETEPAEQMQVDWTWMSKGQNPVGAFVAILGYSRKAFVEFVASEQEDVLLACHTNAFDYFGGVPKNILYDNMKTVVIQRDKYGMGRHGFQKTFNDFAKHFGFVPRLCRPYRAQTKGKVERFNGYLKKSFYYPLITKYQGHKTDLLLLNEEVKRWLSEVADKRLIKEIGKSPEELFEKESAFLQVIAPKYAFFKEQLKEQIDACHVEVMQHNLLGYECFGRFV